MVSISLSQAVRFTELGKLTFTRALKPNWFSASRKQDGSWTERLRRRGWSR
jgi:hypothetical protein